MEEDAHSRTYEFDNVFARHCAASKHYFPAFVILLNIFNKYNIFLGIHVLDICTYMADFVQ